MRCVTWRHVYRSARTGDRTVHVGKLTVPKLFLRNYPNFMEPKRSVPRSQHPAISSSRNSTPSYPIYLKSILMLLAHLFCSLPNGFLPSCFPTEPCLHFFCPPIHSTFPAFLFLHYSIGQIIFVMKCIL
jgi:hypothetical protein